ncbi:MAG: hypothetical protein ACTHMS_19750, partial [Jatrophihabitans sp.]|uniref:hypothetical protein n=1 Tax=Jatrophihabitans sp. TaxID=1932789 RepID=UPI003F7F71E3
PPPPPPAVALPYYVVPRPPGALGLAVGSGATAATTRAEVVARDGGRAARFPGQPDVGGDVPVHELLARTAIDEVERIDGGPVAASDVIETRDFLRPLFREGRLVLPVLPAGDGRVAPFEVPNPTPCCGGR